MARIRTIKPELFADRKVGALSIEARLLFIVLISASDDYGKFSADPGAIWAHGYRYQAAHLPLIEEWLDELVRARRIGLYTAGDEPYGFIPRWAEHQRVDHPSKVSLPEPPRELVESFSRDPRESVGTYSRGPRRPAVVDSRETLATPSRESRNRTKDHGPRTQDQGPPPRETENPGTIVPPASGENVYELERFLDGVAERCGGRFQSAWFGDRDRVMRFIAGEPPAVRLAIVSFLADQARVGWRTPGMATQVAGRIAEEARRRVERDAIAGAGLFDRTDRSDRRADETDELLEQTARVWAGPPEGWDEPERRHDYEASPVEEPGA